MAQERTLKAGMRNVAHVVKIDSITKSPVFLAGTFVQPRAKGVEVTLSHPENYRELYKLIDAKKIAMSADQKKIPMENEMIVKTIKAASVTVLDSDTLQEAKKSTPKANVEPPKEEPEEEDEFQVILREGATKGASKKRTVKGSGE